MKATDGSKELRKNGALMRYKPIVDPTNRKQSKRIPVWWYELMAIKALSGQTVVMEAIYE